MGKHQGNIIDLTLVTSAELRAKHPEWPLTVDDATALILARMSEADKAVLRKKKNNGLIQYHFGWGMGIRNEFGLWEGNYSLMSDCRTEDPDEASLVIIQAVWQRLKAQSRKWWQFWKPAKTS